MEGEGELWVWLLSPPKLLKLPQNALLAGPAPSWELKTKNKAFSPKKVLSQRLGVVPGEGEELLNRFPQILPQSEGMEEQVWGMEGLAVVSLPSPQ